MGLIIGIVVGFLIGFITGARAKQLIQATKLTATALKTIIKSMAPSKEDDKGAAEEAAGEEAEEEGNVPSVDDFMNNDNVPGLDDHPDLEFSPVFLYKVKVAKEEARREKRRQQLLTEGYDPDQMDEAAAEGMAGGGQRQNALATLIQAGARVKPVGGGQSAEAALREDRRRQIKTIETYMTKNLELDTQRVSLAQKKVAASSKGKKYLSALDAARLTTVKRAGTDTEARTAHATTYAKAGRHQLREILSSKPQMFADLFKEEVVRRGAATTLTDDKGGRMTAADLAGLLEGEDGEGEEGEEGDFGEEGAEEGDAKQLEA